jgi:type II secretory pathway pseudopilin PulG
MKTLSLIAAALMVAFGGVTLRAANLDRISAATGVPIETLQAQRASTGLGWGSLEKAHLLANATGQSFDDVVALHQSGQGWGKIARDNGLNLGKLVSDANRSSNATMHAKNTRTVRGKSTTVRGRSTTVRGRSTTVRGRSAKNIGRGHTSRMTTSRSVGHRSRFRSGFGKSHGMRSMGHAGRGGGRGR